jgi:hypothetical protein
MTELEQAKRVDAAFFGERCQCGCFNAGEWIVSWLQHETQRKTLRCTTHVGTIQCSDIDPGSIYWVTHVNDTERINLVEWRQRYLKGAK